MFSFYTKFSRQQELTERLKVMSDYHISKDKDGWKAIKAGGQKASARADTKAEIQAKAKQFAINSGGGEVREHASRNGDQSQIRQHLVSPSPAEHSAPPE